MAGKPINWQVKQPLHHTPPVQNHGEKIARRTAAKHEKHVCGVLFVAYFWAVVMSLSVRSLDRDAQVFPRSRSKIRQLQPSQGPGEERRVHFYAPEVVQCLVFPDLRGSNKGALFLSVVCFSRGR